MRGDPTLLYGSDIYTEAEGSNDTLASLGPLRGMAGTWTSARGADVHPVGAGSDIEDPVVGHDEHSPFVEHFDLQPIDPQNNGPQRFYGLRYHIHITRPDQVATFHDQVGYWLWEPAAERVILMLAIPRGQVLMAAGSAKADATEFEVSAAAGAADFGILSNPFLLQDFATRSFRIKVTVHGNDTWSYEEHTEMRVPDRVDTVDHVDRNTLHRVAAPIPNPMAAPTS